MFAFAPRACVLVQAVTLAAWEPCQIKDAITCWNVILFQFVAGLRDRGLSMVVFAADDRLLLGHGKGLGLKVVVDLCETNFVVLFICSEVSVIMLPIAMLATDLAD